MKEINNIPKELLNGRNEIEGGFVFCLWKNPYLYSDYIRHIEIDRDFLLEETKFYYGIGKGMYLENFTTFDETSISLFLSDKKDLKEIYDNYGGYSIVNEMINIMNEENVDVFYDKLMKSNTLIELHLRGFAVLNELDRFENMTSDQVYDFYDLLLNNIMVDKVSKVKTVDLGVGYEEYIKKWDDGIGVGFQVGYPILHYHLAGIHKKNLILHLAGIGQGKTTSSLLYFVLPVIKSGESICIIANEQDEEEWRRMLLATVISNEIGYFGMNRQKLILGNFSKDDKIHIKKALDWLEQYKDQIHFAELVDYETTNVKRIIKRYSKLGVQMFLFDTFKPQDDSDSKAWGEFSELAKDLFLTAKEEDVAIVATAQLSPSSSARKFLDLSCIGKSRAIAETSGQVTMFRPMRRKEKEKLKVYTYNRDSTGEFKNKIEYKKLNPDKDYIILFVTKNRYGKAGDLQIVYQRNMDFNTMEEIGYCNVEYDGFE